MTATGKLQLTAPETAHGAVPPPYPELPVAKWPFRPQPQPDELLSSYVVRVANGLLVKPNSLLHLLWANKQLVHQDTDHAVSDAFVQRLAAGTRLYPGQITAMTMGDLNGRLFANYRTIGRKPWILPASVDNDADLGPGLQFCPACLATDSRPYFRRVWRLAFVTCCTTHGIGLLDRCPACNAHVRLRRSPSLHHCHACQAALSRGMALEAPDHEVTFQRGLETALATGWTGFYGGWTHSHLHFIVVRQMAAILVNGARAPGLRQTVQDLLGGDGSPFPKPTVRQPIEYLSLANRRRLFDLVRRCLDEFPARLINVCSTAGVTRTDMVRGMEDVPFAFQEMALRHLDRTCYHASAKEVAAAAEWLRKSSGRVSVRDLKEIFGKGRAATYRQAEGIRRLRSLKNLGTVPIGLPPSRKA